MIVGQRKPMDKIFSRVEPFNKLLILGCGSCVTVCMAGGLKEAEETAALITLHRQGRGRPIQIKTTVAERVCEKEYLDNIQEWFRGVDAILSLSCGVGTQNLVTYLPEQRIIPGLDTLFYGYPTSPGVWQEMCRGCGDCILDVTGGICPVARCAKGILNGPCGGSLDGKCEVRPDIDCAWQLIWDRMEKLGRLQELEAIIPPKDWSTAGHGGPRRIERKDVQNG